MSLREQNPNRKPELTPNQKVYWDIICSHIEEFHSFPTVADLASEAGVAGNSAYEMLRRLERKGFLERLSHSATKSSYKLANAKVSISHLKRHKLASEGEK